MNLTKRIQGLRKKVNYQRRYLLTMRRKAATATCSYKWSRYMHKCKAIKKELTANVKECRQLLKANQAIDFRLADVVITDPYNGHKQHLFKETSDGLFYNQALQWTVEYDWQPADERHGYYWLYDQRHALA